LIWLLATIIKINTSRDLIWLFLDFGFSESQKQYILLIFMKFNKAIILNLILIDLYGEYFLAITMIRFNSFLISHPERWDLYELLVLCCQSLLFLINFVNLKIYQLLTILLLLIFLLTLGPILYHYLFSILNQMITLLRRSCSFI
jgi:hypothetical protein